jgi:hypothetical protein
MSIESFPQQSDEGLEVPQGEDEIVSPERYESIIGVEARRSSESLEEFEERVDSFIAGTISKKIAIEAHVDRRVDTVSDPEGGVSLRITETVIKPKTTPEADIYKEDIADSLEGVGGEEAVDIRQTLSDIGAAPYSMFESLSGVSSKKGRDMQKALFEQYADTHTDIAFRSISKEDSRDSFAMRDKLIELGVKPKDVISQLGDVGSSESIAYRRSLLERGLVSPADVARSMNFVDTPEAMELRRELLEQGASPFDILNGLEGAGSKESLEMRREFLEKKIGEAPPYTYPYGKEVCHSLLGVSGKESMEFRQQLKADKEKYGIDNFALLSSVNRLGTQEGFDFIQSFVGDPSVDVEDLAHAVQGYSSPESVQLRRTLLEQGASPISIGHSLRVSNSLEASQLLSEMYEEGLVEPIFALDILGGASDSTAMELREKIMKNEAQSENFDDIKLYLAQSLQGVYDTRSMGMRETYFTQPSVLDDGKMVPNGDYYYSLKKGAYFNKDKFFNQIKAGDEEVDRSLEQSADIPSQEESVSEDIPNIEMRELNEAPREGDIVVPGDIVEPVRVILESQETSRFEIMESEKATEHTVGSYIVRYNDKELARRMWRILRDNKYNVDYMISSTNLDESQE